MHFLLSTLLLLGAVCIGIRSESDATQVPLQDTSHNFFEKPSRNSTSHLIFDTVNSFLQHWTNTRYRNGEMIVGLISPHITQRTFNIRAQHRPWNNSHRHSSLSWLH